MKRLLCAVLTLICLMMASSVIAEAEDDPIVVRVPVVGISGPRSGLEGYSRRGGKRPDSGKCQAFYERKSIPLRGDGSSSGCDCK